MPHIALPEGLPGIRGPMAFRPEIAKPMNEMVDVLLRAPHPLTGGVAAHIVPVCTTAPVMMRVQIANFRWSPTMQPRNCWPVRSLEPVGVAFATTSA